MARSVTIADGHFQVALPDGNLYDEGETATLTDDQFLAIREELIPDVVIDNGEVDGVATDAELAVALAGKANLGVDGRLERSEAPPVGRELIDFIPGRSWSTNFAAARAATDDLLWELVNLTRTTDSGRACAVMTAPAAVANCLLRENIRHSHIRLRYRVKSDATYTLAFAINAIHSRYLSAAARVSLIDNWWHSSFLLSMLTAAASLDSYDGGALPGGFPTAAVLDRTTTNTDRILELRTTGSICYGRNYFLGTAAPTWQRVGSLYGSSGVMDAFDTGRPGASMLFTATAWYELTVIELIPTTEMLPGDIAVADSTTGLPVGWTKHGSVGGGGSIVNMVSVADQDGVVRPVMHLAKPDADGYDGVSVRIYSSYRKGEVYAGRISPDPHRPFSRKVKVRVWSKGSGVVCAPGFGTKLGGAAVVYYYDAVGVRNTITTEYYRALGPVVYPNPAPNGEAEAVSGAGSWGWTLTEWIMPLYGYEDLLFLDLFVGIHDPGSTGEIWISDVSVTPV